MNHRLHLSYLPVSADRRRRFLSRTKFLAPWLFYYAVYIVGILCYVAVLRLHVKYIVTNNIDVWKL
jgi:hypothetical protein